MYIRGENGILKGRVIFFPRGNGRKRTEECPFPDPEELEMYNFLCQDGGNYQQESWEHFSGQTRSRSGEPYPPCQSLPASLAQKPPGIELMTMSSNVMTVST